MPVYSNLDIVNLCDSFPSPSIHPSLHSERLSTLTLLLHNSYPIGYLLPSVIAALRDPSLSGDWWTLTASTCHLHGSTPAERTRNMRATLELWRAKNLFRVLAGWRNEDYVVYGRGGEVVMEMERAATALFGVVTYGVHMTGFIREPSSSSDSRKEVMKIWTPRRSATKATYPGMLDNTVAGGISVGYTPWETLIKESSEEASLPEDLVRENAKCVGTVSYFLVRNETAGGEVGLLQPEVEVCYDIDLTGTDVVPKPCDDEVEEFELLEVEEVKRELKAGRFKQNCGMVMLDFFIRHGILTPENEPDYLEIVSRIHRTLEFPVMSIQTK